jgi:hypothetical protein
MLRSLDCAFEVHGDVVKHDEDRGRARRGLWNNATRIVELLLYATRTARDQGIAVAFCACVNKVQQTITGYMLQGGDHRGIVDNMLLHEGLAKQESCGLSTNV